MKRLALALAVSLSVPAMAQTVAPQAVRPASGELLGPVLHVHDLARSLRFYVEGLGMMEALDMGPPQHRETILSFGRDPRGAGIVLLSTDSQVTSETKPCHETSTDGYDRTIVRMTDLAATSKQLQHIGSAPSAIRDAGHGHRVMMVCDPDGYRLELVESVSEQEKR